MNDRIRRTHAQWIELIEEQSCSTLSIVDFCKQRSLAIHSFYHHKQKMNQERLGNGFLEISSASSGLRLRMDRDGWIVELERGFDRVCMRQLLRVFDA